MNWDAVGAISEIVGAIAVVLTLGYLAIQIRHGTELSKADAHAEATDSWRNTVLPLIDPETAELFIRGCESYLNLNATDQLRFSTLLANLFYQLETVLERRRRGFVDDGFLAPYNKYFRELVTDPGVKEYLDSSDQYHSPTLYEWLEKVHE